LKRKDEGRFRERDFHTTRASDNDLNKDTYQRSREIKKEFGDLRSIPTKKNNLMGVKKRKRERRKKIKTQSKHLLALVQE